MSALTAYDPTQQQGLRAGSNVFNPAQNPSLNLGGNPGEKFMGQAQQVPRPGLPGANPAVPGAAPAAPAGNPLNGTASALNGDAVSAAQRLAGDGGATGGMLSGLRGALGTVRGAVNGTLGKIAAPVVAGQAIGDSMAPDSTDRYAARFGVAPPTGDGSMGDIAKFAALRAGGFASDLGNHLTMGLAGKLYADNQPGAVPPAPAAGMQPGAGMQPAAPTGALPDAATPSNDPAEVNNAEKFGLPIQQQRDALAQSPVSLRGGFGNENLTTNTDQGSANLRASVAGMAPNQSYLVSGLDSGSKIYANRDANGQLNLTGTGTGNPSAAYEASDQYKQGVAQAQSEKAQLAALEDSHKEQDLRDAVQNSSIGNLKANRQNLTDFMAQKSLDKEIGSRTSIAMANRMWEARKMQVEQANKDREFGQKQGNDDFSHMQDATKNLTDRFGKMFTTTDKDGKSIVDSGKAAQYTQGVQQYLGNWQNGMEKKIQQGAASPAEIQQYQLSKRVGVGALDEQDIAHITSLMNVGERSKQTDSRILGNRYVAGTDPSAYEVTGRSKNLLGSDTLHLRGGGAIRENDLRYTQPGNYITPNLFQTPTNEFDLAKQAEQQRNIATKGLR